MVSLRQRRIGVRQFVFQGLSALVELLASFELRAEALEDPVGVWLAADPHVAATQRKIAAVGLRIQQGVSNHGFSLNVCCDLTCYADFVPCGMQDAVVTSLQQELGTKANLWEEVVARVAHIT